MLRWHSPLEHALNPALKPLIEYRVLGDEVEKLLVLANAVGSRVARVVAALADMALIGRQWAGFGTPISSSARGHARLEGTRHAAVASSLVRPASVRCCAVAWSGPRRTYDWEIKSLL